MPHSDPGVQAARDAIEAAALDGNKTAREMLKNVRSHEKREARDGEQAVERP